MQHRRPRRRTVCSGCAASVSRATRVRSGTTRRSWALRRRRSTATAPPAQARPSRRASTSSQDTATRAMRVLSRTSFVSLFFISFFCAFVSCVLCLSGGKTTTTGERCTDADEQPDVRDDADAAADADDAEEDAVDGEPRRCVREPAARVPLLPCRQLHQGRQLSLPPPRRQCCRCWHRACSHARAVVHAHTASARGAAVRPAIPSAAASAAHAKGCSACTAHAVTPGARPEAAAAPDTQAEAGEHGNHTRRSRAPTAPRRKVQAAAQEAPVGAEHSSP